MSLIRIPFMLMAAAGLHVSVTPPVTPERTEIVRNVSFREQVFMNTGIMTMMLNKVSLSTMTIIP